MVSHQIDDVHCKFQKLEELEKNGWVIDVPKKKPIKVCVYITLVNFLLYCVSTSLLLYLNILLVVVKPCM